MRGARGCFTARSARAGEEVRLGLADRRHERSLRSRRGGRDLLRVQLCFTQLAPLAQGRKRRERLPKPGRNNDPITSNQSHMSLNLDKEIRWCLSLDSLAGPSCERLDW